MSLAVGIAVPATWPTAPLGLKIALWVVVGIASSAWLVSVYRSHKRGQEEGGKVFLEGLQKKASDHALSRDVPSDLEGTARRLEEKAQEAIDDHAPSSGVLIDKTRYLYAPDTSPSGESVFRERMRYVADRLQDAIATLRAT